MWDNALLLGNPEIDKQHRELFDHFEKLSYACIEGCEEDQLKELLKFLDEYTQKHFSYEEAIMLQNKYPKLKTQQVQHEIFRKKIKELLEMDVKAIGLEQLSQKLNWELLSWYKHHIMQLDKEMVNYIKAQQHY